MRLKPLVRLLLLALLIPTGTHAAPEAPDEPEEDFNAHYQATYIWQQKANAPARYSGPLSLSTEREGSYSFTATAAWGWRPWQGGELYLNPEMALGVPLSNLTGLGGFTNAEMARTAGTIPRYYRARLFLRQTWGFGGGSEYQASEANQLAGHVDKRRLVLTAGNLSVLDIFDDNRYSHDPRTQFMNWTLMTHGAYDYAANARGYSWGAALEYYHDAWALRVGRFIQPRDPNGLALDFQIFNHYGDQIELEHAHTLAGQPGKLRALVFRNVAPMARFSDAIALGQTTGSTPDLNLVRGGDRVKYGLGLNLEQALSDDLGFFARASWADGKTETYAFTEVDRSLSAGFLLQGTRWGRAEDTLGIAWVGNQISKGRRTYLEDGGISFFIGDGALNARAENVIETFYNYQLFKALSVGLDYQHIRNPAYNGDRGPINVGSVRLHLEF